MCAMLFLYIQEKANISAADVSVCVSSAAEPKGRICGFDFSVKIPPNCEK